MGGMPYYQDLKCNNCEWSSKRKYRCGVLNGQGTRNIITLHVNQDPNHVNSSSGGCTHANVVPTRKPMKEHTKTQYSGRLGRNGGNWAGQERGKINHSAFRLGDKVLAKYQDKTYYGATLADPQSKGLVARPFKSFVVWDRNVRGFTDQSLGFVSTNTVRKTTRRRLTASELLEARFQEQLLF